MGQYVEQHVPQGIVYNTPRRPAWQFHLVGGMVVALIGFVMMLTGGLAAPGIVVLAIGMLYCGISWVIAMVQGHGSPPMEFPPVDRGSPN
jgi:hypothetical protein